MLLKNLDNKLSHSEAGHSEVLTALRAMQESLASISASTWFEQGVENCGLSKKDDIVSITNTLKHVSSQLHNLSGDGDASPLTLADLMTQLSDLNTRLATLEEEVQGVATAAVVVEEISTIKSVRSLEHQADMAAGERMREAVLGLDEFVRGQLDQVNAVSCTTFTFTFCPFDWTLTKIFVGLGTGRAAITTCVHSDDRQTTGGRF